jgi:DUF2075 family protein/predicted GIY-YIG superfamily endonuclease
MNSEQDFKINKIEFNNNGLNSVQSEYFISENWPVVYILNDRGIKQAYVGETTDTKSRMSTHLQSGTKNHLKEAHLISSRKFNKSATLDIESNLIKYLHADGQYKLLNGNLGLVNHSYYQRDEYYKNLFYEIWNALIRKGIAQHSIEHISNSDLFKYSPYKILSLDQRKSLMLIIDALISDDKKSVFIEGGAGTGKSILAIFLFKLMLTSDEDFNYKEFGEDELEFINKVKKLKLKYPNPKMGLVIAMSSFRKTIKSAFKNIQGLNQNMVIGPSDLANSKYDILFVDEAHRLRKRVNLTNYASFDSTARALGLNPNKTNELEWTQIRSKKNLYFYDPKQSIKPTDVNPADFNKLKSNSNSKIIQLFSQFRSKGGNGYVQFVDDLLDQKIKDPKFKYNSKNYEVLLFESFGEFVSEIKSKNSQHQLCRFVAGYGWKWISKNDKSKHDIVIDGLKFQWNHDNIEFILKDEKAEQIGCIHTTQGYDLNYVGVIFGPEIILNPKTNQIEVLQKKYYDTNGQNTITDSNVLKQYIINIYKTIMLRGILGCYLYICDEHLRNYFKKHVSLYDVNDEPEVTQEKNKDTTIIPFENSVPLYPLKVAAGEFYLNESLPEQEFIRVPDDVRIKNDHFACKIIGNSMNKIVKDGEIALFKKYRGGSRNGLMVLAEYYDLQDVDFGSCYTFKEYSSQKKITEEGWEHKKITLSPRSYDSTYQDIVINAEEHGEKEFKIIGIFERVIG